MKYALLIIDLQKEFYNDKTKDSFDSAIDHINAILPSFRKKNLPIVWIQDEDEEDGVVPGKECFDFVDSLEPLEGEYRVHKKYANGFNKTNLEDIIKDNDVDIVVVTGFCAEYCVLSTYRGALDRDITPVIMRNGLASFNNDNIRFVEDINEVISFPILRKLVEES